jgi:hypothetical protein
MVILINVKVYAEFPDVGKYDLTVNINNHIFHDLLEISRVIPQAGMQSKLEGFFQVDGLQKEVMKGTSLFSFAAGGYITSLTTKVIENGVESKVLLQFIGTEKGAVYLAL